MGHLLPMNKLVLTNYSRINSFKLQFDLHLEYCQSCCYKKNQQFLTNQIPAFIDIK